MLEKLSAKQQMVLDFLKYEIKRNGYPPTVREICNAVGLSSTSTVHAHLESLERKGYIRRSPTKNRSTEVLEPDFYNQSRGLVNVPIVQGIDADTPVLAAENIEGTFPVPAHLVQDDMCFMVHAWDDSLSGEGILRGDRLLVRQQQKVAKGDVMVVLQKGKALIKRFASKSKGKCELIGKVIGLYRDYLQAQ